MNQVNEHLSPRPQMKISFLSYEVKGNERFVIRVNIPESVVKPVILKYKNIPSIFMRRDGFTMVQPTRNYRNECEKQKYTIDI